MGNKKFGTVDAKVLQQGGNQLSNYSYIINGGNTVSQRGDFTGGTTAVNATYFVDRWKSLVAGNVADIDVDTTGQPTGVNGNILKYTVFSTGGSGRLGSFQIFETETADMLEGQEITFSSYVKSDNVNARVLVFDGTWHSSTPHTGGGGWEQLSVTFTASTSISANTLQCNVQMSTATDGAVTIAATEFIYSIGAKLELGSVATPFVPRLPGEELALCQRYYYRLGSGEVAFQNFAVAVARSATEVTGTITMPVEMRTAPTHVIAGSHVAFGSTAPTSSAEVLSDVNRQTVRLGYTVAGATAGQCYIMRANNDTTAYVALDAEL